MNIESDVLRKLDELIELGKRVLGTRGMQGVGVLVRDDLDLHLARRWVTSSKSFLQKIFGSDSVYYREFRKQLSGRLDYHSALQAHAVLESAKADFGDNQLFDLRRRVEADIFDGFLEQAEYLLSAGYYQPAAVLAGTVLEDGLRKLCAANNIVMSKPVKLDKMNAELARAGVLSKLTMKRVTADADLRNKAAHGEWDEFTREDVANMLKSVRTFMEKHFT